MSEGNWHDLKSDGIFESIIDKIKIEDNKHPEEVKSNISEQSPTNNHYINQKTYQDGKIVVAEQKEQGNVSWKVHFDLIRLMGISITIFLVFCLCCGQSLIFVTQWWLSSWANANPDDQSNYRSV